MALEKGWQEKWAGEVSSHCRRTLHVIPGTRRTNKLAYSNFMGGSKHALWAAASSHGVDPSKKGKQCIVSVYSFGQGFHLLPPILASFPEFSAGIWRGLPMVQLGT